MDTRKIDDLAAICCSRTIKIRSMSWKKPIWNQKEGEQPPLEAVHDDKHELEQPTIIKPVAPTTQEQPVPTRVYTPKVPYPVPAKKSRKNCEEMKCMKMLEELNAKLSLMDTIQMIPSINPRRRSFGSGPDTSRV
ncbi:hypothetical protein F2Q69_00023947 [Brassica cretica]|uniref:Uncharacterized protein n=1 Tax=Brassica cretica TaxID=69181 RepID=A0A8S9QBZ7_BRACR|nr:hypothetical protein F2Q69_00023947 [Brassica cretica]